MRLCYLEAVCFYPKRWGGEKACAGKRGNFFTSFDSRGRRASFSLPPPLHSVFYSVSRPSRFAAARREVSESLKKKSARGLPQRGGATRKVYKQARAHPALCGSGTIALSGTRLGVPNNNNNNGCVGGCAVLERAPGGTLETLAGLLRVASRLSRIHLGFDRR